MENSHGWAKLLFPISVGVSSKDQLPDYLFFEIIEKVLVGNYTDVFYKKTSVSSSTWNVVRLREAAY